jgi:hypothetical protein
VTLNVRTAFFLDAGDVHSGKTFRFDHPHLSAGIGFRYQTIVGPLRLDFAAQLPEGRVIGEVDDVGEPRLTRRELDLGFAQFPGAVHLTIGEAF